MKKISVLLVDDHEVVRAGYRRLLEGTVDIAVIAEASSGEEAYRDYFNHHPDVLVMTAKNTTRAPRGIDTTESMPT